MLFRSIALDHVLAENGLPMFVHLDLDNDKAEEKLVEILELNPARNIILCHCGMNDIDNQYEAFDRAIRLQKEHNNLWLEISWVTLDFLYKDLEKYIDDFSTRDLMYYFREISEESGYRYVISNIKKDMAIMKRLKTNYSNREICGMIEFLYMSDQDYLEKDRLSPNLLASQWVNTIYADMQLWVEDKYVPKKAKKAKKHHEWSQPVKETNSKIGDWEE